MVALHRSRLMVLKNNELKKVPAIINKPNIGEVSGTETATGILILLALKNPVPGLLLLMKKPAIDGSSGSDITPVKAEERNSPGSRRKPSSVRKFAKSIELAGPTDTSNPRALTLLGKFTVILPRTDPPPPGEKAPIVEPELVPTPLDRVGVAETPLENIVVSEKDLDSPKSRVSVGVLRAASHSSRSLNNWKALAGVVLRIIATTGMLAKATAKLL